MPFMLLSCWIQLHKRAVNQHGRQPHAMSCAQDPRPHVSLAWAFNDDCAAVSTAVASANGVIAKLLDSQTATATVCSPLCNASTCRESMP